MLPAFSALAVADPYEIATLTRFYTSPGSRVKSRYEAYLLTADGRHRLRLSRNEVFEGPVWENSTTVGWVERFGKRLERFQAAAPTFRRRWVAQVGPTTDSGATGVWRRANALTIFPKATPKAGGQLKANGDQYWIHRGSLRFPITNSKARWQGSCGGEGFVETGFQELMVYDVPRDLEDLGQQGPYRYLTGTAPWTAHEAMTFLFVLDLDRRQVKLLPLDAVEYSVRADRNRFAAHSERRLEGFTDYMLWVSDVYVGQLPSGQHRKVPLSRSHTLSVDLRP